MARLVSSTLLRGIGGLPAVRSSRIVRTKNPQFV
uniref:Uncharacterized protein n=1 Tax=Rhizophora mucronata TaxID=61149 RepID=A0A2P2JBW4_RHIMU